MIDRPSPPPISTNVIIIGAGVSGIFAAKELHRKKIDFWLLGSPYESQLAKAGELENTSLPDGTIGLTYIEQEMEQLKSYEINHRTSSCTGIEKLEDGFLIKTKFQDFQANYILIATGNKQKSLGFEGEDEFFRKGISDCTICDYPLYRDKKVGVVGNHAYTIKAAKLMRKHTDEVVLLWYNNQNAPELKDIVVYNNVTDLIASGDETLNEINFSYDNGSKIMEIQGLFVEGQPVPSTNFLGDLKLELHNKHIKVDEHYQTSNRQIFAAGDIIGGEKNFDEAAKDGTKAAQSLIMSIEI